LPSSFVALTKARPMKRPGVFMTAHYSRRLRLAGNILAATFMSTAALAVPSRHPTQSSLPVQAVDSNSVGF
jgi:hypothetical protein